MGRIITYIAAATLALASAGHVAASTTEVSVRHARQAVEWQRDMTWHFQDIAGAPRTSTTHAERRTTSVPFLRWMESAWNRRRLAAKKHAAQARRSGDMGAWMCIHRREGSWTDSGSPYWGGLQMDMTFQSTYGPEFLRRYGTADHWPIIDQIIAARRARDGYAGYRARGYGPWPKTGRLCGLIG